jgi:hypothetical protein
LVQDDTLVDCPVLCATANATNNLSGLRRRSSGTNGDSIKVPVGTKAKVDAIDGRWCLQEHGSLDGFTEGRIYDDNPAELANETLHEDRVDEATVPSNRDDCDDTLCSDKVGEDLDQCFRYGTLAVGTSINACTVHPKGVEHL